MDCDALKERLSAYLDGEVTDTEKKRLEEHLASCVACRRELDQIKRNTLHFDLSRGGLMCGRCSSSVSPRLVLSKGSIKQLLWLEKEALSKADRIRFSRQALDESLNLLETFVPYHLGQEPRSLTFLRQIRQS